MTVTFRTRLFHGMNQLAPRQRDTFVALLVDPPRTGRRFALDHLTRARFGVGA